MYFFGANRAILNLQRCITYKKQRKLKKQMEFQ